MHIHLRVHHWVLWWFYVGVACGAVALVNFLVRDLTRTQERVIVAMGMLFWPAGGHRVLRVRRHSNRRAATKVRAR